MKYIIFISFLFFSFTGLCQLPKCIKPRILLTPSKTIVLPINFVTDTAFFSLFNGHGARSIVWGQDSGAKVNIASPNNYITQFTNFVSTGRYVFHVTVMDSCGAYNTAYTSVNVNSAPITIPVPAKYITSCYFYQSTCLLTYSDNTITTIGNVVTATSSKNSSGNMQVLIAFLNGQTITYQ